MTSKNKIAFLFPGSGSQHIGMGLDLWNCAPAVRTQLELISRELGYDLTKAMFEGPRELLFPPVDSPSPTVFMEVTLALSLAVARALSGEGIEPDLAAGRSMGEYSAFSFAGVFDPALAMMLARTVTLYGQKDCLAEPSSLVTILGLDESELGRLAAGLVSDGELCEIVAFYRKARLGVVGVRNSALVKLKTRLEKVRHRATVSKEVGAFHTSLFNTLVREMEPFFGAVRFEDARIPIYCNYTARKFTTPGELRENLLKALNSPVRWEETLSRLVAEGVGTFVEMAPGAMLTEFIAELPADAVVLRTETADNYRRTVEFLKRRNSL